MQLNDEKFLRDELLKYDHKAFDHAGLGALQLALFEGTAEAHRLRGVPQYAVQLPDGSRGS